MITTWLTCRPILRWREWLRRIEAVLFASAAPVGRDGLKEIFGKEISRDLIGRLSARNPIGTGPRAPRRGAP